MCPGSHNLEAKKAGLPVHICVISLAIPSFHKYPTEYEL